MKTLSRSEQTLVVNLGVYGIWLLKHAKQLPRKEKVVRDLMIVYRMHSKHPDNPTMGMVMGTIDCVIRDLEWEPLWKDYETALRDYLGIDNLPKRRLDISRRVMTRCQSDESLHYNRQQFLFKIKYADFYKFP